MSEESKAAEGLRLFSEAEDAASAALDTAVKKGAAPAVTKGLERTYARLAELRRYEVRRQRKEREQAREEAGDKLVLKVKQLMAEKSLGWDAAYAATKAAEPELWASYTDNL